MLPHLDAGRTRRGRRSPRVRLKPTPWAEPRPCSPAALCFPMSLPTVCCFFSRLGGSTGFLKTLPSGPLEWKQRGRSHLAHRPFPLWPAWNGTRDVLRCAGRHGAGPPACRPLCPGPERWPAAADAPSTPGERKWLAPGQPASEAEAVRKAPGTPELCCLTSSKTPFGSERPTIKAWKTTKRH